MKAIVTNKSLYITLDGKDRRINLKDPLTEYLKLLRVFEEKMREEMGIPSHLNGK